MTINSETVILICVYYHINEYILFYIGIVMGDLGINRLYIYIYRCSMKSPSFWYINSLSLLSFPYFINQIMVEFMELEFQCSRYFVCLRSKIYILEKIYHTNIITINMRCFAELTHTQASTKSFPSRIYKNSIVWFVDIYIYIYSYYAMIIIEASMAYARKHHCSFYGWPIRQFGFDCA